MKKLIVIFVTVLLVFGLFLYFNKPTNTKEKENQTTTPTITQNQTDIKDSKDEDTVSEDIQEDEEVQEAVIANEQVKNEYYEQNSEYVSVRTIYQGEGSEIKEEKSFDDTDNNLTKVLNEAYKYGLSSSQEFVLDIIEDSEFNPIGIVCIFLEQEGE